MKAETKGALWIMLAIVLVSALFAGVCGSMLVSGNEKQDQRQEEHRIYCAVHPTECPYGP